MRYRNPEKTKRLFRAIGEIDDWLVHEAEVWRPQRSAFPRMLMIAACLTLALSLSVGAFLISMRNLKQDTENAPNESDAILSSLDTVLLEHRDTATYTTLSSADKLDFFSGAPCVVWRYADSQSLCVSRKLTAGELQKLTTEIDRGTSVGVASPSLTCQVWILPGDGTVISPYLKSSSGNVGTELFDYNAELIPTERFNSCISEILN